MEIDNVILYDNIHKKKWRIKNLYSIVDKKKKTVLYKPNMVQLRISMDDSPNQMVLKARQLGITTAYIIDILDDALFTRNYSGCILSHDRDSLEKLFKIVTYAYKNMNPMIKPDVDKGGGSKYRMYFPSINSEIYVSLEVRSTSLNRLHVSEYGLMKDKTRYNASVDAVVPDGKISIESTPKGLNHFYDDWKDENFPYSKHFFPWYFAPEYVVKQINNSLRYSYEETELIKHAKEFHDFDLSDEQILWRRFKIRQKGFDSFREEYPEDDESCFIVSGKPILNLDNLKRMKRESLKPRIVENEIRIFKTYKPDATYVAAADVSEGVGGDYSCVTIWDADKLEQVASWRGQVSPFEFAKICMKICTMYGVETSQDKLDWPLLAIERNNHGHAVIQELDRNLKYLHLFEHNDKRIGWLTNKVTRPLMLDTFVQGLDNCNIIINDATLFNECFTLVNNNGKIEACSGKHDDTVIASAIALQLCLNKPRTKVFRITAI